MDAKEAKHVKLSAKEHEALTRQTKEITALGERLRNFVTAEVQAFYDKYPQGMAWSFSLDEITDGFRTATILGFDGQLPEKEARNAE